MVDTRVKRDSITTRADMDHTYQGQAGGGGPVNSAPPLASIRESEGVKPRGSTFLLIHLSTSPLLIGGRRIAVLSRVRRNPHSDPALIRQKGALERGRIEAPSIELEALSSAKVFQTPAGDARTALADAWPIRRESRTQTEAGPIDLPRGSTSEGGQRLGWFPVAPWTDSAGSTKTALGRAGGVPYPSGSAP